MKYLLILVMTFQPTFVFAECNPATDIKRIDSSKLEYSNDCHKEFGKLRKDIKDAENEIVELRKSIDLKDLALQKSDEQLMLWRMETYEQHERLLKISNASDRERWLWFGIGILVMGAATYSAGQLR